MNKKEVIILRGLPGCGKTWVAEKIKTKHKDVVVVSADDFHTDGNGKYEYNKKAAGIAHMVCGKKFAAAIKKDVEKIVVDNTNVKHSEYKRYKDGALGMGYAVTIVNCNPGPIGEKDSLKAIFKRQVHNVPLESFLRFWWDFQPDPHEIDSDVFVAKL